MKNYYLRPSQPVSGHENRPGAQTSIVEERENVQTLIDETIRMIENTQKFIDQLDRFASPAIQHMEETAVRLERSLDFLRRRRDELSAKF